MIEVYLNGTDMLKLTNDEHVDIVATDGTVLRVTPTSNDSSYFVLDPRASEPVSREVAQQRRAKAAGSDPQFWMKSKIPHSACANVRPGESPPADCEVTLMKGDVILYDRQNRKGYCKPCGVRVFPNVEIPEGLR
jgi:hypothetical protein